MGELVSFEPDEDFDAPGWEAGKPAVQEERSLLEKLQDLVLSTSDMQEFLNELAVLSARSVSGNGEDVLCGITLLRRRRAATVAYNSETAKSMDELQYAFKEGPCLTAASEQRTIVVDDFATENRWPEYSEVVSGHGLRSILSAPFTIGAGAHAAMNLYSYRPGSFRNEEVTFAESYARQASKGLQLALRMAHYSEEADNRSRAMESRTDIDVAVGIVMAQNRCSQAVAFEILQRASNTRNVKLRVIAAEIVQRVSGTAPATHFDG
ncbi:GAF and ANTAR domain-containing protein [Arthrobacter tumbae]|uniref:GAF and ANTAR domain-containing protein n=1 Tax=Arthrobacter tumbae TaxID=163874 RepID=UPI0027DDACE0|nr:GAF and ANTAR domain-containing protein [Arthrobacter tumbae]MBM7779904.1 GAF domain-containing protein [Arthrobacter tumbae]